MCYVITLATPPIITHANKAPSNWHVRVGKQKTERERCIAHTLSIIHPTPPLISPLFFASSPSTDCSLCCFFHPFCSQLFSLSLYPLFSDSLWLLPAAQVVVNYSTSPFGITKAFLNLVDWAYFRKASLLVGNWMNGLGRVEETERTEIIKTLTQRP